MKDLKASIDEYIHSEETPDYDPIAEYLNQLPAWDGRDHVREQNLPYWFTPAETRRIEEMNVKFQRVSDLESMLTVCFRRPDAGEMVIPMLTRDVVRVLAKTFPEVKQTQGMNVKVGRLLKTLNYEQKDLMQGSAYFIVPVKSAA